MKLGPDTYHRRPDKSNLHLRLAWRAVIEVVGNGARRLRRFNLSTPVRSGNSSVFPVQTPKRAEARAPTNTNNTGMHGFASHGRILTLTCAEDDSNVQNSRR